jgi:hypothetical protein
MAGSLEAFLLCFQRGVAEQAGRVRRLFVELDPMTSAYASLPSTDQWFMPSYLAGTLSALTAKRAASSAAIINT